MNKYLATIILLFAFHAGFSQEVEAIRKNDRLQLKQANDFAYIEQTTDSSAYEHVATYIATGRNNKGRISRLFFKIEKEAMKDGGNCFRVVSFTPYDSLDHSTLVLDTYYWSESARVANFSNHEKNAIYIFAGETPGERIFSFKVNGEKKSIRQGTYYRIAGQPGDRIKVNTGGMTGTTAKFKMHKDKPSVYLTLHGFGVGGIDDFGGGGVGLAFNTGRFERLPKNLGMVLVHILKQSE